MPNVGSGIPALLALACAVSSPLAAQDSSWSRLTHRPACPPTDRCPWTPGLLWDTTNVMPPYPEVMKAVGLGDELDIVFSVDTSGRVDPTSVRVERSTLPAFVPSTVEAIRRWHFGFSEAAGRPDAAIPMHMQLVYAINQGCPGSDRTSYAWGSRGPHVTLIVLTCPGKLVPRNQVQVPGGPG